MEFATATPEPKDGKLRQLVWIDSDDSIIIKEAIRLVLERPPDKDDYKKIEKTKQIDVALHELWKRTHPSGEKLSVRPSGRQARTR